MASGLSHTAQLALAWILDQKPWIVPIPGTTRPSRIEENIASTEIHFDDGARQKIADALSQIEIVGDRYSAAENKRIGK